MKSRYLISCAVAAMLSGGATAAFAADDSAATMAASDTTSSVTEIVVTAERREQTAQSVPMTMQAFAGVQLQQENITTLDDLIKYTPNVTFGNNGPGQGVIFMRGLSAGLQGNQSSATIATFPNVAVYLDDQSMQFPARNVDIYMVDMQRVEVLEGPQGTLFGGGAEAGAIRYITNKPELNRFSANAEVSGGYTDGGSPNYAFNATLNIPLVQDKLALRLVGYDDHHGGYIDNVASSFTRSNQDAGNTYFNIMPNPATNLCPNGLPGGGAKDLCTLPGAPSANNAGLARNNFNPVTYSGVRASLRWDINDDWNALITESFEDLDAEGMSVEYPIGSNFQTLQPLQVTSFAPSYDHDNYENTSWTLNGKLGPLKAIYTGAYLSRRISQQMDYSNYSRSVGGIYYSCTGGTNGLLGGGPLTCFSPATSWNDQVRNTHLSNEFRVSTPDDWRIRGIFGVFQENFRIYDDMNFNYKTIPACTPANLTIAQGGGQPCLADVRTAPGSTANDPGVRGDTTAFGEDTQRGYDQLAFFGSVDFDIIPNVLTITAGTRWYQYKEFEVGSEYETGGSCVNVPNGGCTGYNPATGSGGGMFNIDSHNDHVTYSGFKSRANITWKVNPDVLAYFTFSEGFRPGGFNRTIGGVAPDALGNPQFEKPNSYAPDSLTNYEWGIKSEFFDHRLLVNISAYYMQWQNVQLLFFNPTELGNTTFGINGPDYDVKGGELQVVAKPVEGLTIQTSGTYNDDEQVNSPCLKDNIPGSPGLGSCITQVLQKGVGLAPFQNPFGAIGTVPAFSPKFEGNVLARYDWNIGEYKAFVQGGTTYISSMFNQPATYSSGAGVLVPNTTLLRYEQPGYGTIDAAIGISKDNWYVRFDGSNLTDSHASMFTSSTQFIKSEVPIRPLVLTVKVGAHF